MTKLSAAPETKPNAPPPSTLAELLAANPGAMGELEEMIRRLVARERDTDEIAKPIGPSGRVVPPRYEDMTLDERVSAESAQERPPAPPLDRVRCISRPEYGGTGATFVAAIVPATVSRGGKHVPPRVVALDHYTRPAGHDRPASPSNPFGLPDGYAGQKRPDGEPVAIVKQYMYERFWLADLRATIGKPLNPAYRMTPEEEAASSLSLEPLPGHGVGRAPELT
jgi:hypothetical protein